MYYKTLFPVVLPRDRFPFNWNQHIDKIININNCEPREVKYIIYLHPKSSTKQYIQLNNFWNLNYQLINSGKLPRNDGMKYMPHVTLTSFFKTNNPEMILENARRSFKFTTNKLVTSYSKIRHPNFTAIGLKSDILKSSINKLLNLEPELSSSVQDNLHLTLTNNCPDNYILNKETELMNEWDNEWDIVMWKCIEKDNRLFFLEYGKIA